MDIERTIEFILEQQAKHEAKFAEIDELLVRGAKMVVSNQEAFRETDRRITALVAAQQETEKKLDRLAEAQAATERSLCAFIDSQRGKNGN